MVASFGIIFYGHGLDMFFFCLLLFTFPLGKKKKILKKIMFGFIIFGLIIKI